MNKVLVLWLSFPVLAFSPLTTLAQAPELFLPVTGSEEAIARAENEYFLKKTLYFAKRHRIVRVNASLLLKNSDAPGEITVNLFDDVKLRYGVTRLIDLSVGQIGFSAQLVTPPMSVGDVMRENPGLSYATAADLHNMFFELSIAGSEFVHDTVRNRYWPTSTVKEYYSHTRPGKLPKLPPAAERFYAFQAEILSPDATEKYMLEPLYGNPRYHVVWEVDYSKSIVKPADPAEEASWSENRKRQLADKSRAYSEYLTANGIGEIPRLATRDRDLRAFIGALDDR